MPDNDALTSPIDPEVIANLMAGKGPDGNANADANTNAIPPMIAAPRPEAGPPAAAAMAGPPWQPPPSQPTPNLTAEGALSAMAGAMGQNAVGPAGDTAQRLPSQIQQGPPSYGDYIGQTAQKAQNEPPQETFGGLPGLIAGLINPRHDVLPGAPTPSKLDRFEGFLGNFLQSLSAGFANEGKGPGAAYRGAAAAMQAPYQHDVQQFQMQQQARAQQAQIEIERQKAQAMIPNIPITGPNGEEMMISMQQVPQYLMAGYRLKGQMAQANARLGSAAIAERTKVETQNPQFLIARQANELLEKGDINGFKAKIAELQQVSGAMKQATPKQNESEWIARLMANPDDKEAKASLDLLQNRRKELMNVRGEAMGRGRLWQLGEYVGDDGIPVMMTGHQYLAALANGERPIPQGRMSADKLLAQQQFSREIAPVISGMKANIGAFDNEKDKLIFARAMKAAGPPKGDMHDYFGTVLDQVDVGQLSDEGKNVLQLDQRLNESLGRLRGLMGLPATEQAMALTLQLAPGGKTPDSKYALEQLDHLKQMGELATTIPQFPKPPGAAKPQPQKPTGGRSKGGAPPPPPSAPPNTQPNQIGGVKFYPGGKP